MCSERNTAKVWAVARAGACVCACVRVCVRARARAASGRGGRGGAGRGGRGGARRAGRGGAAMQAMPLTPWGRGGSLGVVARAVPRAVPVSQPTLLGCLFVLALDTWRAFSMGGLSGGPGGCCGCRTQTCRRSPGKSAPLQGKPCLSPDRKAALASFFYCRTWLSFGLRTCRRAFASKMSASGPAEVRCLF